MYRDHLLNELHSVRVLAAAKLICEQVNLLLQLAFIVGELLLDLLQLAEGCL